VRTDHLTALPNRLLLEERLAERLVQARRDGSLLAIMVIDIDRFKNINDTLGHGVGDGLLKVAATRLTACIRTYDTLSRWAEDDLRSLNGQIEYLLREATVQRGRAARRGRDDGGSPPKGRR